VAGLAVDALEKETKFEKLAESEELDREVLMELEDRKKVEVLKAANECQERDERKAAALAREAMMENQAKKEVVDMKGNIKNMIMNQRAESSKKIAMMKKLSDKKRRASAD